MLGTDRSRGYCLEMICADFLAGAHLQEGGSADVLLLALTRTFQMLPVQQQEKFILRLEQSNETSAKEQPEAA